MRAVRILFRNAYLMKCKFAHVSVATRFNPHTASKTAQVQTASAVRLPDNADRINKDTELCLLRRLEARLGTCLHAV